MSGGNDSKGGGNPRGRAMIYGMGAVYLAYLFFKVAGPFFAGEPLGPTMFQFALGAMVLGGGAMVLGVLAWKMYKASLSGEDEDGGEGE